MDTRSGGRKGCVGRWQRMLRGRQTVENHNCKRLWRRKHTHILL